MPSEMVEADGSSPTELGPNAKDKKRQNERRPALVSLRGELMAVPIPLERDQVIIGRALEADVRTIPTVFLITASGHVVRRWRSVPQPDDVDEALQAM